MSRSFEPPLLLELNSFSVPGFVDLGAQDAWQFELGTRGRTPTWGWQVAAYDIELENEIVNANLPPFPDAPFTVPTYRNVGATRHYGLEAGIDWSPDVPLLTGVNGGDRIGARLAWTWARYEVVEDQAFAGNELPGAPEHAIQAEIEYTHPSGFTIRPNAEWVPDDFYVDSANTVTNDGWATLGLRVEWSLPTLGALAFVEGRNLTDERYAPAVTVDDAAGRYFQPADGRSVYAGLRWELSP